MMVPNHPDDSSSDLVACWPEAYYAPALLTIEALTSLSGAKRDPCGSLNKELRILLALPGL